MRKGTDGFFPLGSPTGKSIMAAAVLASSMAFIDATALNVILPSLQRGLGAGGVGLFWVLNGYLLMLAALILVGGVLGDRLGRKRVYMAGIVLFLVGSTACGCSVSLGMLISCRIVQGAGGALMIPGSLSIISALIDGRERGKAIGTWSSFTTIVTVGGPILGGALADAGLWRVIFFINIPLGLAALLILWRKVPESGGVGGAGSLDWPGAAAVAAGLALLTLGCLRIPMVGWRHWSVLAALAGGVALMAIFLWIEARSKDPMMPLSLFRNRVFSGVNALTFFLYAGLSAAMLFVSLDMVQAQGFSQLEAGLSFLPFTILLIALSRYAGAVADKYGPGRLLVAGPFVSGIGMLLLSTVGRVPGFQAYWRSYFPGMLVFGLGMAATVAPLTATVMSAASQQFSGVASGINNALSRVAGVLANAILGALAVLMFTAIVRQQAGTLPLNRQMKEMVVAQARNLGDAKAPAGLRAGDAGKVEEVYREAFVGVYGRLLRISAGLAFAGAVTGLAFVRSGRRSKD